MQALLDGESQPEAVPDDRRARIEDAIGRLEGEMIEVRQHVGLPWHGGRPKRAPRSPIRFNDARPIEPSMAHVIPFTPRTQQPERPAPRRAPALRPKPREFAALLGSAIGRHHLSPGRSALGKRRGHAAGGDHRGGPAHRDASRHRTCNAASAEPPCVRRHRVGHRAPTSMPSCRPSARPIARSEADTCTAPSCTTWRRRSDRCLFNGTADLFCAAAALTEMAGWMAHDGGDDARAHQHFDRALRFASATSDVELAAHVHASLSHLMQQLDCPRDGLRLAQAGRSDPPSPRSPPGPQRPAVRDGGARARDAASPRATAHERS